MIEKRMQARRLDRHRSEVVPSRHNKSTACLVVCLGIDIPLRQALPRHRNRTYLRRRRQQAHCPHQASTEDMSHLNSHYSTLLILSGENILGKI